MVMLVSYISLSYAADVILFSADIELWSKEAPLACRNFVQLALEGYYNDTSVVRIVKGFMAQMGDPTNTGTGGESIWGKPFKDELHGRIKFNHRGQVAMANSNKPNSNQSQFFLSLDSCDWLNGKHTIFGKITGNTIYNAIRMGEAEVDGEDRPVDPIRLLKIDVVWNPFEDIVPR
jgi:peptidyl-prolyl cis-trans isomerase SDCCAG10